MTLAVASDILRRLQNSLYAFRLTEQNTQLLGTRVPETHEAASSTPLSREPNTEDQLPLRSRSTPPTIQSTTTSPYNDWQQAPSSDTENSRTGDETSGHLRQSVTLNASISPPDGNAQSNLRKRILEIQSLELPERDKARRIQVTGVFILVR